MKRRKTNYQRAEEISEQIARDSYDKHALVREEFKDYVKYAFLRGTLVPKRKRAKT